MRIGAGAYSTGGEPSGTDPESCITEPTVIYDMYIHSYIYIYI